MNTEIIRQKYARMETSDLVQLFNKITNLTPDAIQSLKEEFQQRGEKKYVRKIEDYMASSRFNVSEELIMKYLLVLRKRNLNNMEISTELKSSFGIDEEYIEHVKKSIKSKAKENLIIGLGLIMVPMAIIIFSIIMHVYIGIGAAILFILGMWRFVIGIKLM